MKNSIVTKLSTVLVVLVFLITLVPIQVFAVKANDTIIASSEMLQQYENEALLKYNELIKKWANNPQFPSDDNMSPPYYYAGAYINNEKHLTIQVTDLSDEVQDDLKSIIDLQDVTFEVVPHSLVELWGVKETAENELIANEETRLAYGISGVGISFYENAVCIYVIDGNENLSIEQIQSIVASNAITILKTEGEDTTCAIAYPGTRITSSPASGTRSLGFWAYNSSGVLGFVTAPHSSIQRGSTIYCNGTATGTAGTPYYSGNVDCVFVTRTNSAVTPSRYVGNGFSLSSGTSISPTVGATTYSSGITSGYATGTISDIYYTTSYGISNCIVSSATCSSGDSGGPVASGGNNSTRYLLGIITGKTASNCQITVRASNVLSKLSATVY